MNLIHKRKLILSTVNGLEDLKAETLVLTTTLQADDAYDPSIDVEKAFSDVIDALNTLDMIVKYDLESH